MHIPKLLQRYTTIFQNSSYIENYCIMKKETQPETAPEVHNDIPESIVNEGFASPGARNAKISKIDDRNSVVKT